MVDKKIEPFDYQKSTNIDEHNQIVNKINEIVDTSNDMEQKVNDAVDLVNELDKEVDKATSDISQLKISDAEHTEQIAHLDTVVDNHASEITALKAKDATIDTEISGLKTKDTQHDTEIQGLSESVVTDLVATFDNSSRKLSLSIEREQADSIDAVVTIPAGGGGSGGSYSAGDGIAISDANVISVDDTVGKKSEIVALQNATKPAIKAIEVTETAEKVSITTTALDDATKITEDIGVVSDTKAGVVTPELKKKWDNSDTGSMQGVMINFIEITPDIIISEGSTTTNTINNPAYYDEPILTTPIGSYYTEAGTILGLTLITYGIRTGSSESGVVSTFVLTDDIVNRLKIKAKKYYDYLKNYLDYDFRVEFYVCTLPISPTGHNGYLLNSMMDDDVMQVTYNGNDDSLEIVVNRKVIEVGASLSVCGRLPAGLVFRQLRILE